MLHTEVKAGHLKGGGNEAESRDGESVCRSTNRISRALEQCCTKFGRKSTEQKTALGRK